MNTNRGPNRRKSCFKTQKSKTLQGYMEYDYALDPKFVVKKSYPYVGLSKN